MELSLSRRARGHPTTPEGRGGREGEGAVYPDGWVNRTGCGTVRDGR